MVKTEDTIKYKLEQREIDNLSEFATKSRYAQRKEEEEPSL